MHAPRTARIPALMLTLGLVIAATSSVFAEEATDAPPAAKPAPTMGKVGPGAPPATAKSAKTAKPAKGAKAAPAPTGIILSPVTPLAPSVSVHDKVLEACQLQSQLPQALAQRSTDIVLSDGAGATTLELRIVDIHAPNGGFFSGPKWITVEGRLLQGKTIKGNFTVKESSMGSATACGMLTKVINVIADDIVTWLADPQKNSRLRHER